MKKTAFILLVILGLVVAGLSPMSLHAQTKMACVSISEVIGAMPESKKADTTLSEYEEALQQQFDAYKAEYTQQVSLLGSPDTAKFTKPQLDLKRRSLAEILAKIQGFEQEAGTMLEQKKTALFQPIQKKAEDAIQQVSRDNGYAYVFEKEGLHVYPPSDDILPLVKKRLGLR
jgi:outer membrane protein